VFQGRKETDLHRRYFLRLKLIYGFLGKLRVKILRLIDCCLVGEAGLEPARLSPQDPKSCGFFCFIRVFILVLTFVAILPKFAPSSTMVLKGTLS